MIEVLGIVVHWLHVLAGIVWFGGAVFFNLVLMPSMRSLPPAGQQGLGLAALARTNRIFGVAAGTSILMGLLRGTVFGPIQSWDVLFGSAYGITWLIALVLTIGIAILGTRMIGLPAERLYHDAAMWQWEGGGPSPAFLSTVAGIRRGGMIVLASFLIIFTLMILMRFGY